MSNPLVFTKIAESLLGIIEKYVDPKQYDVVKMKRLSKLYELGEKYIRVNKKYTPYDDYSDEKREKLLDKLEKKFFDSKI